MLIVTANMNLLDDDIYKNFVTAFQQLLDHRDAELKLNNPTNNYRINGIIINGGFANNFTQNNGQNYYKIMNKLIIILIKIYIIIIIVFNIVFIEIIYNYNFNIN